MDKLPIEKRVEQLRWHGFNPIHLWGNVYLVRRYPASVDILPIYTIMIFKE